MTQKIDELSQQIEKAAEELRGKANADALLDVFKEVLIEAVKPQVTQLGPEEAEEALRKMRFPTGSVQKYSAAELYLANEIFKWEVAGRTMPKDIEVALRSMTSGGTATGAELLATETLTALWDDVKLAARVAPLFRPYIDMPSQTVKLPAGLGDVTFYKPGGEGQAVAATDLATGDKDLVAYPVKAQVDISDELDQDSIVALLPAIRAALVKNAAECLDDLLVNADTTTGKLNINYYKSTGSNIGTDSRFLLGFDGLIHQALVSASGVTSTSDLTTLATADFGTLLGLMGKYAANPSRLAFIMDLWTYLKAVMLSDFLTVDKFGERATIVTGQLGAILGVPVIVSGQMLKSNATGYVDQTSGSNTKGRIICVHRDMWKVGMRTPVTVRSERSEAKGLTSIVIWMRPAFVCHGTVTTRTHTVLGFNVTV